MANKKEFLLNRNNVAYCTSCSNKFLPNKNGVLKVSPNMSSFCVEIATENLRPEFPVVRVVRAIPNNAIKEKWIEKNFYVEIPLKTTREEIDSFLDRVSKFEVQFKDSVRLSVRGISRMKKGKSIKYKSREGDFTLEYGDRVGSEFNFIKDDKNGAIEAVTFNSVLKVVKMPDPMKSRKHAVKDSQGRTFSFIDSPNEDIAIKMKECISSEVNTICRTDKFKIVINSLKLDSFKDINKENGLYNAVITARMISL